MKSRKIFQQSGFTLVELMVVVAIIGILASMALPMYRNFQMRARQVGAKSALRALYMSMESYRTNNGRIWNTGGETHHLVRDGAGESNRIGFAMDKGALSYNVSVASERVGGATYWAGSAVSTTQYKGTGGNDEYDHHMITATGFSCVCMDAVTGMPGEFPIENSDTMGDCQTDGPCSGASLADDGVVTITVTSMPAEFVEVSEL
jgi:prepilin-type N-terminal cleavage/methylation domain-containing protein